MDYLKNYSITDEQINNIKQVIESSNLNIDLFIFDYEKIIEILNIFIQMGVTNLYDIIITSPALFCDTVSSIKKRLYSYENKEELVSLLNEDAANLYLVDLI